LNDGGARVTYVTAGHPPPLFLGPSGSVSGEEESELMLGAFPEATFTVRTVTMKPGDVMLGFTDGVTERRNAGRLLGDDCGRGRSGVWGPSPRAGRGGARARPPKGSGVGSAAPPRTRRRTTWP